jgi:serine phosphatase RsbU (regulator of sigma subunit)/DNA-binding response OmpR family regulator/anti-sigma regulatory factor (Ser/Thr protein kinase)
MAAAMSQRAPDTAAPAPLESPILIVDDRADSLLALQAVLEPLGQPILTARSGNEALRHLLRTPVAVILLDVNMPGMDGFSTAALIKRRERTRDIPIIFLTAERDATELGQVELGYSSGAVDFIVKPFDPWVLMSKVSVFVELHRTNEQLRRQLEDLRASRSALATAQRIARLAHFDIDVRRDEVSWSEGAAETLGLAHASKPLETMLPFWPDLVQPADGRTRAYLQGIVQADTKVTVVARAEYRRDRAGRLVSITGTVQDVTEQHETRRALAEATDALEREQEAVTLLQRSMLPSALPQPPGLDVAARYIPAEVGVGGDWYDVTWRSDGQVMLVIGDVAGHGLAAASMMNEIRIAARAFATRNESPGAVLQELNRYASDLDSMVLVTALIVMLDPVTGRGTAATAGHLPPLIDGPDGWSFLDLQVAPPLGTGRGAHAETSFTLPPNGRLVMYTDGLVEQRRTSIDTRMEELGRAFGAGAARAEELADHLVTTMLEAAPPSDDVAILTVHRAADTNLTMRVPALPGRLATLRATLRRWLLEHGAPRKVIDDVVLAVGELATNVCIHAHPVAAGIIALDANIDGSTLAVTVADNGRWQVERDRGGGRGLTIVSALVDDLEIERGEGGTTVRFTCCLEPVDRVEAGIAVDAPVDAAADAPTEVVR